MLESEKKSTLEVSQETPTEKSLEKVPPEPSSNFLDEIQQENALNAEDLDNKKLHEVKEAVKWLKEHLHMLQERNWNLW